MKLNLTPPSLNFRFEPSQVVYMVGIKGVGMTALALMLQQYGLKVAGADVAEKFVTDEVLAQNGIVVDDFFEASLPREAQVVVYGGSNQGSKNALVLAAQERGIPILSLAQAVGLLSTQKETVVVAGVGGKSSTTAILSFILSQAQWKPSYLIGVGNVPNLGQPGHWNAEGYHFVVEGDEYVADPSGDATPKLLYLQPRHAIFTSLVHDHPDFYQSIEDTNAVFQSFLDKIPGEGKIVYYGDDVNLRELITREAISVGEGSENDVQLKTFSVHDGVGHVYFASQKLPHLEGKRMLTRIPGKHNQLNAAMAVVMATILGIEVDQALSTVEQYVSVKRRLELIGSSENRVLCYDDYAHHPREIAAISQTLQSWFPEKKCFVAFQPHTYSRTKALFEEFVGALRSLPTETLYLLPIFSSARESFDPSISSEDLTRELLALGKNVENISDLVALGEKIAQLPENSVMITLGAGDIYKAYDYVTFS